MLTAKYKNIKSFITQTPLRLSVFMFIVIFGFLLISAITFIGSSTHAHALSVPTTLGLTTDCSTDDSAALSNWLNNGDAGIGYPVPDGSVINFTPNVKYPIF